LCLQRGGVKEICVCRWPAAAGDRRRGAHSDLDGYGAGARPEGERWRREVVTSRRRKKKMTFLARKFSSPPLLPHFSFGAPVCRPPPTAPTSSAQDRSTQELHTHTHSWATGRRLLSPFNRPPPRNRFCALVSSRTPLARPFPRFATFRPGQTPRAEEEEIHSIGIRPAQAPYHSLAASDAFLILRTAPSPGEAIF
jgi:hypothetical protein